MSSQNDEGLGQMLAPLLFKTLFELFLLSNSRNTAIWLTFKVTKPHHNNIVKDLAATNYWFNNVAFISVWNAVTVGLAQRMNAILYGTHEGTDTVLIRL
jgi:hypothetical protein